MNEPPLETLWSEEGHRSFACANVVIVYTENDPTRESLQQVAQAIRRVASRFPEGVALMVMVPEHASPPSDQAREAMLDNYRSLSSCLRLVVVVVEGTGFVAAAKRSVMTLINLASPLSFPTKVAATTHDAAAVIVKALGTALDHSLSQQHITAAADAVRSGRHTVS